jgi:amino acid adenylation domain-containing protein
MLIAFRMAPVPDPMHCPADTAAARGNPGQLPTELARNIGWMLWQTAATAPAAVALLERDRSYTYGALYDRALACAEALAHCGVGPGDRVAFLLERGVDAAAAFFGAVALGAVTVNVNETLRPRQIEHILSHAGARVLLTSGELLSRQPRTIATRAEILDTATLRRASGAHLLPLDRVGGDPAQIIYTSGSTGLPKGVTISHANLWAGVHAVTSYLQLDREDRIASLLPFSFDYGFNQLLCAVYLGATLVIERAPLPQQIVATLRAQRITVLPAVPPLWLQLLRVEGFRSSAMPALRLMTNTGGRIPTEAVRALRAAQPQAQLILMYGLTEAFRSTYLPPAAVDQRPDSIGRAIPGAEILVLRDDLTPCRPGEVGELVHRGPTVALGYWDDPVATARVYRPNPLRPAGTPDSERVVFSGDLVRRDDDGFLYHLGRRNRFIKTLGYRVSPDEVAEVLYASGELLEVVVTAEPDEQRGERIIAYVVLTAGGSLTRLQSYAGTELPRYMQPARFEVRDDLPRLPSGKHDLAAVAAASPDGAATPVNNRWGRGPAARE